MSRETAQIQCKGMNPQDASQDDEHIWESHLRWFFKPVLRFQGSAKAFVPSVLSSFINEIV